MCVCAQSLSHVQLFVTPWTLASQASLSLEFSRQEYRSGLPFPTPEESLASLVLAGRFFTTALPGKLKPLDHQRILYIINNMQIILDWESLGL